MAIQKHTELRYKIWHYVYLLICALVFFFLIAPLFVILPLSFNAEQYIHFSDDMLALKPEAFSLRWYEDMVYGTKNPWGTSKAHSETAAAARELHLLPCPFCLARARTRNTRETVGGASKSKFLRAPRGVSSTPYLWGGRADADRPANAASSRGLARGP